MFGIEMQRAPMGGSRRDANLVLAFCFVFALSCCGKVEAAISFGFALDENPPGLPLTTDFVVSVNQTVRISVHAIESGGDTRLTDSGLISAGFQANFNNEFGMVTGAQIDMSNFSGPVVIDNAGGNVSMSGGANLFNAIRPGEGIGSTRIGFFDYEFSSPGVTTFTLVDPDGALANNVLDDAPAFTDLDPELFAVSQSFTFTAIPEPSSAGMLLVVAGFSVAKRRRRGLIDSRSTSFGSVPNR
ncbi:MAG: PEP-CTERM sorting domain-containing protein [Planctomycetota bacterium]